MSKTTTTSTGNPVRNLPKEAIDNRAGQKDPGQDYRGSHGTQQPVNPPTSKKGDSK